MGSILISPEIVPMVIHQTKPEDYQGVNATIFSAIRKLFFDGTPVDVISVNNALGPGYRDYLLQLMEITPTAAHAEHYMEICRKQSRIYRAQEIAANITQADNIDDIRNMLEQAIGLMVDKLSLKITTMSDALSSFMQRHSGEVNYLPWPIPEMNDRLYAEPGDYILLGGRPSAGKSAFALQCAKYWARNMKVGFFSLETNENKLFDRQMSSMTDLTMDDIKRNRISQRNWDQICAMSTEITSLQLDLIPAAGMSVTDIQAVIMMRGYDLVIIDYLQLINAQGHNRTEKVTNISMDLHTMAQRLRVTVFALTQLKRKESGSTPDNSDLRESGQLEQDGDIILQLVLADEEKPEGPRDLYFTKNKEGTCPMMPLAFDGKHQTFSKAQKTGEVVQQMKAVAGKAKRQNREAAQQAMNGQMELLPPSTPVPFVD